MILVLPTNLPRILWANLVLDLVWAYARPQGPKVRRPELLGKKGIAACGREIHCSAFVRTPKWRLDSSSRLYQKAKKQPKTG